MSPWPLQMSDEVVHASTPKTIPSRGTYHRRVAYVTALSLAKSVLGHFMDHTAWKRFRSIFHAFSSGTRSCLSLCSLGSYSGNLAFEFHCSAVCCGSTFCDDYGMPALTMVLAFLSSSPADFNEDVRSSSLPLCVDEFVLHLHCTNRC